MSPDSTDKRSVEMIQIDLISVNPFQPRKKFNDDEIQELASSIETHGLIQPIILRNIGERYQVVAGERRLRASKKLGLQEIPSIIVNLDGVDVAEVSLIENIQRKDLNCIEEAEAFHILKTRFGLTDDDIAKRIGKSRPYVSNTLRLISLPQRAKQLLVDGAITMGHGRALLRLPGEEAQLEMLEKIISESLSVRQTEKIINDVTGSEGKSKKPKKKVITDTVFGDSIEYYNSIKAIVQEIRDSGGKADIVERETDDYFEVVIRLSK